MPGKVKVLAVPFWQLAIRQLIRIFIKAAKLIRTRKLSKSAIPGFFKLEMFDAENSLIL